MTKLYLRIQHHTNLLDFSKMATHIALKQAKEGREDLVEQTLDARKKLIEIINIVQNEVQLLFEESFQTPKGIEKNQTLLNDWISDIQLWAQGLNEADEQTTYLLGNLKDKIKGQIKQNHLARVQHEGYNLNTVKK